MAKKMSKIVRVPATTNNITKGIINYLNASGHFAFRVNSGGVYDPTKGSFRANAKAGAADIICCIKRRYVNPICLSGPARISGEFLAVEVKNKATKDRARPAQQRFGASVVGAHGVYFIASGYNEFVTWFESTYGKI